MIVWNVLVQSQLRKCKLGGFSEVLAATTKGTMGKQFPQSGMSSTTPVTL